MNVYVDNGATTKMSKSAVDAMLPYMDDIYGNPSSLHSAGQMVAEALYNARASIASNLGCLPGEIIFTSGGSEADNQAIMTAVAIGLRKNKKHIVSTAIEHHAVLHTLDKIKKQGFEITLIKPEKNGIITADMVRDAIRDDTCLVTVMYANNEIGTIEPIMDIGNICREKGVIFHTDAVQAAGHINVNVKDDNIDMLSISAHKFHGPKGIGALYCRKGITPATIIEGGAQERGKRAGTENIPAIMGMAAAFDEACREIDTNIRKVTPLRDKLIKELSKIPHSTVNGDIEKRLPGNVNMCFEGIEGESLLLLLDEKGICASSGSACTSGSLDPSHVLLAIGLPHEVAHGSLRLSLSEYNTEDEIDYIIKSVPQVVEYLRSMSEGWKDL